MQNSNACLFIFVIMILQESCMKLRKGVYMTQQLHDNRITTLYTRDTIETYQTAKGGFSL